MSIPIVRHELMTGGSKGWCTNHQTIEPNYILFFIKTPKQSGLHATNGPKRWVSTRKCLWKGVKSASMNDPKTGLKSV